MRRNWTIITVAAAALGIVLFWPDGVNRPPAGITPEPTGAVQPEESPDPDDYPNANLICFASGSSHSETEITCYRNGEKVPYSEVMKDLPDKDD